ncbi:uncharacterized protein Dwil_GK14744 [Drosophila willistoni]|uniref:UDP-glucuronosyltransferase n=1 Tax=Drosophila willistoni TaxID=7260 RepID=B4MUT9_DROWI|nr:uncharacterized protein Dwil_GK14744 [Drosophila willistoni]
MRVLADNGHNVTIVTSLKPPIRHKDFNVIHVPLNAAEEQRMSATYLEMLLYGHDSEMPKYEDLTKNVSLIFFNSHSLSEGPIRPNLPGIIEIGGIQVKDQPDPLPNDIANFLDNSKHGAILFSLGSNVRSSHLSQEVVTSMYRVLSGLKQNVIWKWDEMENIPGNSSNIMFSKWLPQDDILAHPNIKLFITHAGKGGIIESQYHGKPMLALPVFADQPYNAAVMVNLGFGLSLEMIKFEETLFKDRLNEVLDNPKYTQSVENFSRLYRDRPLTARETVLYWTEYVLRHHGAKHLQSPIVHMSFIEANNLDIFGIFLSILVVNILFIQFLKGHPG